MTDMDNLLAQQLAQQVVMNDRLTEMCGHLEFITDLLMATLAPEQIDKVRQVTQKRIDRNVIARLEEEMQE